MSSIVVFAFSTLSRFTTAKARVLVHIDSQSDTSNFFTTPKKDNLEFGFTSSKSLEDEHFLIGASVVNEFIIDGVCEFVNKKED